MRELDQPLEYSGEVFRYKTQADIAEARMREYALEFLTNDDPQFTRETAMIMVNRIEQAMYFIDIEEIFENL